MVHQLSTNMIILQKTVLKLKKNKNFQILKIGTFRPPFDQIYLGKHMR